MKERKKKERKKERNKQTNKRKESLHSKRSIEKESKR